MRGFKTQIQNPKPRFRTKFGMTKRPESNCLVMLVSASDFFASITPVRHLPWPLRKDSNY